MDVANSSVGVARGRGVSSPKSTKPSQPITTVMLRNIPNKYTQRTLLDELCRNGFACSETIDFFYLPIDSQTNANFGYAFINFTSVESQERFRKTFEGQRLERYNSRKILTVVSATLQGLEANWNHYSMSTVMSHPEYERRPLFFNMHWSWASWNSSGWKEKKDQKQGKENIVQRLNEDSKEVDTEGSQSFDFTDNETSDPDTLAQTSFPRPQSEVDSVASLAKFCGACGSTRIKVANFCSQCGAKFHDQPGRSQSMRLDHSPPVPRENLDHSYVTDDVGRQQIDRYSTIDFSSRSWLNDAIKHHEDSSSSWLGKEKSTVKTTTKANNVWKEIGAILEQQGIARSAVEDFLSLSSETAKQQAFRLFQIGTRTTYIDNAGRTELLRTLARERMTTRDELHAM